MIGKKQKQNLIDKHLLLFGHLPSSFIQTPGRIEWFGGYPSFHGGSRLTSTINRYLFASISANQNQSIRIISSGFPVITLDLQQLNHLAMDDVAATSLVKSIILQLTEDDHPLTQGIDVFIESELKGPFGLGSSSAFALTVLTILLQATHSEKLYDHAQIIQWVDRLEKTYFLRNPKSFDAATLVFGGTLLVDHGFSNQPVYQSTTKTLSEFELVLVDIKHTLLQESFYVKQILEQMTIIAHHYQKGLLVELDHLQVQHDLTDLTRMYGSKTTNKLNYFYQETQLAKLAYLSLEKQDEGHFFHQFMLSEKQGEALLEYHLIPQTHDQRLHSAIKWMQSYLPDVHYRLHGLGFEGPLLCLIPKEKFGNSIRLLKRQFYEQNLLPITMVKQGIKVFKT
jgi:galactokinase